MAKAALTACLVTAALGGALALPGPAAAVDTDNRCLVWASRYALVDQSRFLVVFAKDNPHVNSAGPTYYGCVFSRERAQVLARQGEGATLSGFQLNGRYVAYADQFLDPAVAETSGRLLVFDAKQGTGKVDEAAWPEQPTPPPNRGFSDQVTTLVVKANGSVAWIGRMFGGSDQENLAVQKVDENGKAVLDRGPEIGPRSLAKARDELTIYWTEGGVPATAPLS